MKTLLCMFLGTGLLFGQFEYGKSLELFAMPVSES
jgi:hypothetical protein